MIVLAYPANKELYVKDLNKDKNYEWIIKPTKADNGNTGT